MSSIIIRASLNADSDFRRLKGVAKSTLPFEGDATHHFMLTGSLKTFKIITKFELELYILTEVTTLLREKEKKMKSWTLAEKADVPNNAKQR